MIRFLFLVLFSFSVMSAVKVEMDFASPDINQGELIDTKLQIEQGLALEWQKLKGQTIGKTIYFYDLAPPLKKQGDNHYEIDARVIFVKVPESFEIEEVFENEKLTLNWGDIKVAPTQSMKSFLFGTFEVPEKSKWMIWTFSSAFSLLVVGIFSLIIRKRLKVRKKEKERKVALRNEILECKNYDDVVGLWKRKHVVFSEFPHVIEPFRKMEEVLNRHQFKPKQSEAEKIEVYESYRKFIRMVEGGFNGI